METEDNPKNDLQALHNKTAEALQQSESFNRGILASLSSCVAVIDEAGTIITVNKAWEDFAIENGVTRLERVARGSNYFDVCNKAAAAGDDIAAQAVKGIQSVLRKEIKVFELQYPCHAPDKQRWFLLRVMLFENGQPMAVVAHNNITEIILSKLKLEESENHLRTILDTEPECIKLLGPKGELQDMNPAGLAMIEADNLEMVKGKPMLGIVDIQHRDALKRLIQNVFNGESGILEFEITGLKGTHRWLEMHAVPMKDGRGEIISLLGVTRDITEQKKADEALRQSEETQRLIMNSALDAIICMDTNGIITTWTPQAEKIFGWKEEEVLGKTVAETIVPAIHREHHKKGLANYVKTGERKLLGKLTEIIAINREGKEFPVELTIVSIKQGTVEFFCAFIRDISERKKAAELLRKSEIKLREITASLPGVVYQTAIGADGKMKFTFLSEGIKKFEDEKIENIYKDSNLLFSKVHPDDVDRLRAAIALSCKNLTPLSISYRIFTIEGIYIWVRSDSTPFLQEDGTILRNGALIDITETKEAEEKLRESEIKFRSLVENIHESLVIEDKEGRLVYANSEFSNIFGFSEDEFKNLSFKDYTSPEFYDEVLERHNNRMKGIQVPEEFEYKGLRKDGSEVWIECRVSTIMENGKIVGTQSLEKDITERKLAEFELKKAHEQINYHINNTPLAVIEWDKDDNVIQWNKRAEELFGWTAGEVIGNPMKNLLVYKDDADLVNKSLEKLVQGAAKDASSENRNISRDGKILYCQWYNTILTDERGNIETKLSIVNDITKRKLAEEKVKESEEKYRTLMQQAGDSIVVFDDAGQLLDVNESALQLLGYGNGEYKKLSLKDFVFEDDLKKNPFRFDLLNKGEPTITRRKLKRKDGLGVEAELHVKKLSDGRYLGVARDLTERIKAEKQIRESEQKYRSIFEKNLAGIYQTTPDGKILTCNEAFVKMLGYNSQKDLLQKNAGDLYFYDTDRNEFITCLGEKGELNNQEIKLKKKDGTPVYMIENCSLRKEFITGEEIIEGVVIDITERKKAEEKIKFNANLLSAVGQSVIATDINGLVIYWNHTAEKIYGWSATEATGKNIIDLTPAQQSKEQVTDIMKELSKGNSWSGEFLVQRKGGEIFPAFVTDSPFFDQQGRLAGIIGVSMDISERKKTEQALTESEETFRRLFNESADSILLLDDTGFTECNQAAASILGYSSPQEVLIKQPWEISPEKQPDGRLSTEKAAAMIAKALKNGYNRFEWVHTKMDGTEFPVEVMLTPIILKGKQSFYTIWRDIAERKKAEQELTESEHRYRSLVEQASDGILMADFQGNIIEVNSALCSMFGYTKEEALQKNMTFFLDPKNLALKPIRFELLSKGHSLLVERKGIHKNGNLFDIEISSKQIGEGKLLSIIRDISERKKAQEQIRLSEEKYRSFFDQSADAIFIFDESGHFLDVNRVTSLLLGYTRKEILNMSVFDIVFKEDLAAKPIGFELLATGKAVIRQRTLKKKDSTPVEVEIHSKKLPDGKYLGVVRDITERKKAEELIREKENRFRSLIDTAPDATIIADEKGIIRIANRQAVKLFGYTITELIGMPVEMLMPEQNRSRHKGFRRKYIQDPHTRAMGSGRDLVAVGKDGIPIPVEISLAAFHSVEGILVTASIRDITQRKKAEKELEESYHAVRQLTEHLQDIREEERTHIAREIHDELGQQLTVMIMDVSWLDKKIGAENKLAREKIKELMAMLDGTVKSVRRISSELRPSILDDLGLAAAMEFHLKEFEKRSGIHTRLTIPKTEPELTGPVKNALFRIFQESLTNVARHSGAKNVTAKLEKKNKKIVLKIADDGVGFDEKKAAAKKTLGVLGMKERAAGIGGSYIISGASGKGTSILVNVPLPE